MISLETSAGSFNVRTVGVAIQDEQVLLHRAAHDTWWALPGGRVELHESSADALVREMREEMGVEVEPRRLLWVLERFFVSSRRHHSIQFYYLMQVPEALFPASAPTFSSPQSNDTPLCFTGIRSPHWNPCPCRSIRPRSLPCSNNCLKPWSIS